MKRTTEELYEYETKRQKEYEAEFMDLIQTLNINELKKFKLQSLFEWYGNARAIKSKAYQEMKANKKE